MWPLFAPFFLLVLLGWLAVRLRLMPTGALPGFNTFVLFFGLPAMVFRLAAHGALTQPGLLGWLAAYAAGGLVVLALSLLIYSRLALPRRDTGMLALATTFPNTGFLGLPLLAALQGAGSAGPVMGTLVVDVLLISTLALVWAHSSTTELPGVKSRRGTPLVGLRTGLKGPLRNPLLWSMLGGMASSQLALTWPEPLDKTLQLLAQAASPTALFVLGGMLASRHMARKVAHTPPVGTYTLPMPALLTGLLLKLGLHPAMVWLSGQVLQQGGVTVPTEGLVTLSLAAALPSASNVLMLAEHQQARGNLVASLILWTTLLSMPTLMAWSWWLHTSSNRVQAAIDAVRVAV
jgi:malonate transporter